MSLDSEVPPSKYLSSESRDTTKLLKNLAKKSSSATNNAFNTSHKFKSIVNNVQTYKEELLLGLSDVKKNCQEGFTEVDEKIATIIDEAKTKSDEMMEMKKELNTKLEAVEAVTTAQVVPNTEKLKEIDTAMVQLYKKMGYIESIVLNFSKSYYEMDDKDLKNLITKQSIDEKVSVTSNTDNKTKPLQIPMPIKLTKEQQLKEETPSFSLRKHTIGYDI